MGILIYSKEVLMEDIVARCGYKCNLCLTYRENIKSKKIKKDKLKFETHQQEDFEL